MSQIKLLHSGGNGVILSAPNSNPSSDINLKLPQADGSSGQFLKTDGSGNLSFATVADTNDFVKLQAATGTSAVSDLTFQNLDVTTYRTFKFVFSLQAVTDNSQVFLQLFDGSTLKNGSGTYNWSLLDAKQEGGTYDTAAATEYVKLVDSCGNNNYEGSRGELTFVPHVSGDPSYMNNFGFCFYNRFTSSNYHRGGTSYFKFHQSDVTDGFKIYFQQGNIAAYSYTLYGLKR